MIEDPFKNIWVEKYRPKTDSDLIANEDVRALLTKSREDGDIPNLMFHGTQGLGKTTLAKILAYDVLGRERQDILYINASEKTGIDVIRTDILDFAVTASWNNEHKIVILDEVDGLSSVSSGSGGKSSAQQALRNVMEEHADNVRFILTCNYLQKVIPALQSRCMQFVFRDPPIAEIVKRAGNILKAENVTLSDGQKEGLITLVRKSYPDIRRTIQELQRCSSTGSFVYREQAVDTNFAAALLTKIRSGADVVTLRKEWIGKEQDFANDYFSLLKGMFESTFECDIEDQCKRLMLIAINDAIYKHHIVMDAEINFFACVIAVQNACR